MNPEYLAATAKHSRAFRAYDNTCKLYRARKIDDAAFLAARAIYTAATAEFDMAFAAAAEAVPAAFEAPDVVNQIAFDL